MKKYTKAEVALIEAIAEASGYAKHELELDYIEEPEYGTPGWYACDYIEGVGAEQLSVNGYDRKPLISDAAAIKNRIDVPSICAYMGIAYCE